MFNTALQSTLREMQRMTGDYRSWILLFLLSVVIGMVGPFGTFDMPLIARFAYWLAVVVGTSLAGIFVSGLIENLIGDRLHRLPRAALAGGLSGLPITLLVVLINLIVFGPIQPFDALTLAPYCMAICAAVTVIPALFVPANPLPPQASSPAVLKRLPLPLRGRLIHLAVSDHYVEVATDKGKALVLMRLSDAIGETAPVAGLQVHRSHWVALDAVRRTSRQSGKPMLELVNGTTVPISRGFMAEAKAAGLL